MNGMIRSRIRKPRAEEREKKRRKAVAPEIVIHDRYPPVLLVESSISTQFFFCLFALLHLPGPARPIILHPVPFPPASLSLRLPIYTHSLSICLRLVLDTAQQNKKHTGQEQAARKSLSGP